MKKLLILFLGLWLISCSDRQLGGDTLAETTPPPASEENEFKALIEQARWGNGKAFLKLANCYRDGKGVEKDLMGMVCMGALAENFGAIARIEDFFHAMPEDSEFRMIFEATELAKHKKMDEAKLLAEKLITMGAPDGYTLQGMIAIESGDELEGIELIEQAAAQGSTFAEMMLVLSAWHGKKVPDMDDEHLAAQYYLKADECACLNRRGARWLLNYHRHVSPLSLSERDIERIQILAGETEETDNEDNNEEADDVSIVEEEPIE